MTPIKSKVFSIIIAMLTISLTLTACSNGKNDNSDDDTKLLSSSQEEDFSWPQDNSETKTQDSDDGVDTDADTDVYADTDTVSLSDIFISTPADISIPDEDTTLQSQPSAEQSPTTESVQTTILTLESVAVESVKLEFNEKTMNRNDILTLNPTIFPADATDKSLAYATDNQNVVTVSDDGKIYAVSVGNATVTCTASNGIQATCEITVIVPVQSINIKISEININRGTEFDVSVEISPSDASDKSFSISSSDENVIRQSGDKWLACGGGTAKITASTSNGVAGSVDVTVDVPVESIKFDEEQKTVNRYDNVTLNPVIFPSDATDKSLTYKTDDQNVVTVSNDGNIYAAGAGTATITCTASNGVQTTCEITVVIPVTSIYIETDRYRYKTGETAGFKVTVYPEDATDKSFTVNIMGTGGSLTDTNTVLCASSGKATITVTASNGVSGEKDIEIIDLNEYAAEVIRLTNIERTNQALSSLSESNSLLSSAAMIRAAEIIESFSHTRPNGSSCFTVFDDVGLSHSAYGENIAYGHNTPKEVVDGWMNSQGHKENILRSHYTHIGVGVAMDSSGGLHWVQMFMG